MRQMLYPTVFEFSSDAVLYNNNWLFRGRAAGKVQFRIYLMYMHRFRAP